MTTTDDHTAVFHPLNADLIPRMTDTEFSDLVADIARHGQREPIIVNRNSQILDGRHRWLACKQLGIEPRTTVLDIDQAQLIDWMVSYNLKRRHLTTTQRAAIAAKIANLKQGGAQPANLPDAKSQATAAKQMGVSLRSVGSAVRIAKASPDLQTAMLNDVITTHAAEQIIKLPTELREAATTNVMRGELNGAKATVAAAKIATDSKKSPCSPPKRKNRSFHAVYGSLFSELEDLPVHLKAHPLNSEQTSEIVLALKAALTALESGESNSRHRPESRGAPVQPKVKVP